MLQAQLYADPPVPTGLLDVGIGKAIPEGRLHIMGQNCVPLVYDPNMPPSISAKKHILLESELRYGCFLEGTTSIINQKWAIHGGNNAGLGLSTSYDGINFIDLALFNENHTTLHAQEFSIGTYLDINANKSNFKSLSNVFESNFHFFPAGGIKFYNGEVVNGNLVSKTASQNNSIEWFTSGFGADYGHKIYNHDPGNHTELVIAAQHANVWRDAINISSDGKVGIGGVTGANFDDATPDVSLILKGSLVVINPNDNNKKHFKLENNGNLHAREILVDLATIPDYVFKDNYKLMPLDSLQKFVEQEHHLPGIKSEKEYEAEGNIKLRELNLKLLEKIEEQTLYIIQMNKKIEELEKKINK